MSCWYVGNFVGNCISFLSIMYAVWKDQCEVCLKQFSQSSSLKRHSNSYNQFWIYKQRFVWKAINILLLPFLIAGRCLWNCIGDSFVYARCYKIPFVFLFRLGKKIILNLFQNYFLDNCKPPCLDFLIIPSTSVRFKVIHYSPIPSEMAVTYIMCHNCW